MIRAIYDAARYVALSVSCWSLDQASEVVRAVQRRVPGPEPTREDRLASTAKKAPPKKSPETKIRRASSRREATG